MALCPLCNQFRSISVYCSSCKVTMQDKGRIMDYFDDYSAYLSIDMLKMSDGITEDLEKEQCPHLFYCPSCNREKVHLITEENN
ncbi:hypothetical protein [Bacillus solimangrovi]|uniref:Uncharacterized protein n=1 Tax=Bacillus solimangrovi TaxID=1305675 RepID=A0A1E5LFU3_9BACI|nr:hypothetical protein [Bacillus solimangrovi]OEH92941.1 hypothetical protein BFG57_14300 [Bacillus solimangrovi]